MHIVPLHCVRRLRKTIVYFSAVGVNRGFILKIVV